MPFSRHAAGIFERLQIDGDKNRLFGLFNSDNKAGKKTEIFS